MLSYSTALNFIPRQQVLSSKQTLRFGQGQSTDQSPDFTLRSPEPGWGPLEVLVGKQGLANDGWKQTNGVAIPQGLAEGNIVLNGAVTGNKEAGYELRREFTLKNGVLYERSIQRIVQGKP